ncbi:MAG: hypothetical protein Q7R77_01880 [Candidatus Daviesbacteria bacterium]|nr:hypothetical protein [Candidatus Daviesbacteria bacterium]
MLQILPGGFITEQKAYLIFSFLLALFACYLIVKKYSNKISDRIIFTSLLLFSSVQVLILRVSLADIQFMAWWILALVFLDNFIQTKKEKYVALFLIPASLIPLTRYAGITVTLILSGLLVIYSIINYKSKKFSINFIILAAIFTLIPISLYLFRNFILNHALFGYYDPQYAGVNILNIALARIKLILNDILLPLSVMILLGTRITWRKEYLTRIILFSFPILIYLSMIIIQQSRFRILEFIPSRYTSPFYPIILLVGLLIGSWLSSKFAIIKRVPKVGILLITLLSLGMIYYSAIKYFVSEFGFASYRIPETEYSYDIQKFCNFIPNKKRYLFLQYDSRNWVTQSLYYFCKPITWITMTSNKVTLPKESVIFSPYELSERGLKKVKTYHGIKDINLYLVESETELDIKKEVAKLESILQ